MSYRTGRNDMMFPGRLENHPVPVDVLSVPNPMWPVRCLEYESMGRVWLQERNVANTSHRYCVNFIGCRSDDELNSRLPAWYTKCCQAQYLAIWPTIFISPQKVLLAPSGPLQGESVLSLVFTVVLVTDILLQLDHVLGTTYLPVCETRKSAAQNSENNWKHSCFRRTAAHRDFFDYCAL